MVRIALAQIDPVLGEVDANLAHAREQARLAASEGADLVVFPELATHGYFLGQLPDDRSLSAGDERLLALTEPGPDVLIGFHEGGGIRRYNSAAYLSRHRPPHVHRKLDLPTYIVWEERKHASPGRSLHAFDTPIGRMATLICNDAWQPALPWLAVQDGAEVLLVPTASASGFGPASLDTVDYWLHLLRFIARMQQCWVVFCNRVGTEAGARFWGGSRIIDPEGHEVVTAPLWAPDLTIADIDVSAARRRRREVPLLAESHLTLVHRELTRLLNQAAEP